MQPYFVCLAGAFLAQVHAWKCSSLELEQNVYDLSALDSEYTIESTLKTPPTIRHTTYNLNPCSPLKRQKNVDDEDQCVAGTSVCKTTSIEKDKKSTIIEVIAYAGDMAEEKSPDISGLDEKSFDAGTTGFKLTYSGGRDAEDNKLSTIINFVCDKESGAGKPELSEAATERVTQFKWLTKYACAGTDGKKPSKDPEHGGHERPSNGSSWGFFTWFFLVVFMLIASILIFTLFLNYNRYGQIGLDFVPAMDSVKVRSRCTVLDRICLTTPGCALSIQGLCKSSRRNCKGISRTYWLFCRLDLFHP